MPPGGSDDEFRSTVFDESFIRRARLQECSAQERLADHEHPVRPLPPLGRVTGSTAKQVMVLLGLVILAFGTAMYMGLTGPSQEQTATEPRPLRATIVPLVPRETVPGGPAEELFSASQAAGFGIGADGVELPADVTGTRDFSDHQIRAALTLGKKYVVESSLDSGVLTGGATEPVRDLLVSDQRGRFDRSMRAAAAPGPPPPDASGQGEGLRAPPATAWLVRLDTEHVALADPGVRVSGTLTVTQQDRDLLEVTADHVFVYAVGPAERAAGNDQGSGEDAALFTVRRQVRLQIEREDLPRQRLSVEHVVMQAGPLPCSAVSADELRPILAGQSVGQDEVTGIDPYADRPNGTPVCGTLAGAAQPSGIG